MSNIIKFPESEVFEYRKNETQIFGVVGKFDLDLEMMVDDGAVNMQIGCDGDHVEATRKDMAKFLWAAAYFLDSDQEWAENEYPALNK